MSARPRPGSGRNTSCWWMAAVPALIAPSTRLGLCAASSAGPATARPTTSDRNPGACASITCSMPVRAPRAAGAASTVLAARHVRVRPHRLGARRRAGRVGRRHLPEQQERVARHPAAREVVRDPGQPVDVRAEVHGARAADLGRRPRDRAGQRPVHLDRRVVPVEVRQVGDQPRRQVRLTDQLPVQRRRRHVGQHRPPRPHDLARPRPAPPAPDRPPTSTDVTGRPQSTRPPRRGQPPHQRRRELPGAALRHREPDLLAQHREQPPEHTAARVVRAEVGVHARCRRTTPARRRPRTARRPASVLAA